MKVAILGFGLQGKSSFDYFSKDPGNEITICDKRTELELPNEARPRLGDDYLTKLDEFDLIVRSPSVHPAEIVRANDESILQKITTNTNEFFKACPSKNIIGVTGTKGKGTTSMLITKMLRASGKNVHLGGNIGTPPLDMLGEINPEDWVVLELANFQLIDLASSPKIAVCLMVAPEHLDWHPDVNEYIEAKQQLFRWQNPEDTAIYYALDSHSQHVASISKAQKIPYMKHPGADVINGEVIIDNQKICTVDEIKLPGKHNWQNICAALTVVWQIAQNVEAIKSVIKSFTGMEHRLQEVATVDGVKYYDDSFGTTPETAIVAMEAFKEPKILILGGSDKGAEYSKLAEATKKNNVKAVISIGKMGPVIASALRAKGYTNIIDGKSSIEEIVRQAKEAAVPGDIVLFSTACASFDMFKNYKDRGEQFTKAVKELAEPRPQ
jgi:UDP-N-acetylmuramoylalanine--D-glutamate ligase